jgi:hypothetical protein
MSVDGLVSAVALVLVTHAHRAVTALAALRTTSAFNNIS